MPVQSHSHPPRGRRGNAALSFWRAMLLSRGDFTTFFDHPISATIIALIVTLLAWAIWSAIGERRRALRDEAGSA